jgi:hypothetical protein
MEFSEAILDVNNRTDEKAVDSSISAFMQAIKLLNEKFGTASDRKSA